MRRTDMAILAALAAGACSTAGRERAAVDAPPGPSATQADIRDPSGRTVARASVSQLGDALRVRIEATGLAPGIYGAHVHSAGRCDAPAFESAGPHWNPTGRQHGRDNPAGQHLGDLPNLMVGTDGRGSFEFTIPGAALSGGARPVLDGDGAAVVVHARPDDYRTDPSGNSGARIACGVLG
ncbi:MAG TPA: superoxide dismutase family protein [Allosphingosinicella sp.]|nr:superoxide dismutase family protein [Allosphingosinicella sp.]